LQKNKRLLRNDLTLNFVIIEMAKQETYISFIVDELRKGNINRENILSNFVEKWQTSSRTFDRHWKTANER